jgi:arylsulfatase A-like enzyme
VAPKSWFEKYPFEKIKLPQLSADDRLRTPSAAYFSQHKEQDAMSDEKRREATQAYHASVSFMDAQVGHVLAALDRLGFAENTVVVFTSDHGYHLGNHGLWQKRSLFERSARVPLIVAAPKVKAKGQSARGVVELLDLYPTLAELGGLKGPTYLAGTSLAPVLDDATEEPKDAAFTQVHEANLKGYSVRSERWRYIEFGNGTQRALLFDIESDPQETKNLAADPAHAATVTKLKPMIERITPKP